MRKSDLVHWVYCQKYYDLGNVGKNPLRKSFLWGHTLSTKEDPVLSSYVGAGNSGKGKMGLVPGLMEV